MYRFILLIALGSALLLESGCTTTDPAVKNTIFPESTAIEPQQLSKLASGDAIELSVEVEGTMEVVSYRASLSHEGVATLPLVGEVKLGGCTMDKAQDVIAETYGAYYVQPPVIMLSLVTEGTDAGAFGTVIVMGKVGRPGRIALRSAHGMNLTEAIQEAGGFGASAKRGEIRVTRTDKDGKKLQVFVDYDDIGQGGDAAADIKLISGDIVYVPERIW
ncbi:SLBB domain-containing protein [Pontiellaceae bacterium B12227]|nr:SLBB domain-containing protein [Pontiellaceae bacterium B12227]